MKSFEVYNPSAGRWLILHWWTDHERGHLAFARTQAGLLRTAAIILREEPHATMKEVLEIEMVAPSDAMVELAARHDRWDAIEDFCRFIVSRLTEAREAGQALPPPFSLCDSYESENPDEDQEWAKERHYDCKHCMDGLRLSMSKEDFFDRYSSEWERTFPPRSRHVDKRQPVRKPSKAMKAFPGEKLWYARSDFGHHRNGIVLEEVILLESEEHRPACLTGSTLFFFRILENRTDIWAGELVAMSDAALLRFEEEKAKRDAEFHRSRENESSLRVSEVVSFFKKAFLPRTK